MGCKGSKSSKRKGSPAEVVEPQRQEQQPQITHNDRNQPAQQNKSEPAAASVVAACSQSSCTTQKNIRLPGEVTTIRIFCSSTFVDTHEERDILIKRVFPEVNSRLRDRHIQAVMVDLRWGVSDSDSRPDTIQKTCLNEIDHCRVNADEKPWIIALRGERLGWVQEKINPPSDFESPERFEWMSSVKKEEGLHSITSLEVMHGITHTEGEGRPHSFVYFRNPEFKSTVPEKERWVFDFEYANPTATIDDDLKTQYNQTKKADEFKEKMDKVDEQLKETNTAVSRQYHPSSAVFRETGKLPSGKRLGCGNVTGLEEWEDAVVEDLITAIDVEFPEDDEPPTFEDVQDGLHQILLKERSSFVVGRDDIIKEMETYADVLDSDDEGSDIDLDDINENVSTHRRPLIVHGEPGCGKSAIMAELAKRLQNKHQGEANSRVITHLCGASPESLNLRNTISRLIRLLVKPSRFMMTGEQTDDPIDDPNDPLYFGQSQDLNELLERFPKTLEAAAKKCNDKEEIILIIDAVNQMDVTDNALTLHWIPTVLPPKVRVIVSMLTDDHGCFEAISAHYPLPNTKIIPSLNHESSVILVREFLKRSRKQLTEDNNPILGNQMEVLMSKDSAHSPLYLVTACNALLLFGIFEKLTEFLRDLPGTFIDLFEHTLESLEKDHGAELVKACLAVICLSSAGILENELAEFLDNELNWMELRENHDELESSFGRVFTHIRMYVTAGGSGMIQLFHQQLELAVRRRYLNNKEYEGAVQLCLARFYEQKTISQPHYGRALFGLAHHAICAWKLGNDQGRAVLFDAAINGPGLLFNIEFLDRMRNAFDWSTVMGIYVEVNAFLIPIMNHEVTEQAEQQKLGYSEFELITQSLLQLSSYLAEKPEVLPSQLVYRLPGVNPSEYPRLAAILKKARSLVPQNSAFLPPEGLQADLSRHGVVVADYRVPREEYGYLPVFNKDGSKLLIAGRTKTFVLVNGYTGHLEVNMCPYTYDRPHDHYACVTTCGWLNAPFHVVSGSQDNRSGNGSHIKIYDTRTSHVVANLGGIKSETTRLIVTDTDVVIAGGENGIICAWQAEESLYDGSTLDQDSKGVKPLYKVKELKGSEVLSLVFSPDEKLVYALNKENVLVVFNTEDGEIVTQGSGIEFIDMSPNGEVLMTGSSEYNKLQPLCPKTLKKLDIVDLENPFGTKKHPFDSKATHLVFTDNERFAVSDEKRIFGYTVTGKLEYILAGHSSYGNYLRNMTYNAERDVLASVGQRDDHVRVWSVKKALQQPLVNPNGTDQNEHTNEVTGLTFDGKHLYSIDKKGLILKRDYATNEIIKSAVMKHGAYDEPKLASHPDHDYVFLLISGKTWTMNKETLEATRFEVEGVSYPVHIEVSPNGKHIVISCNARKKYLFLATATESPVLVSELQGHTDTVYSSMFSEDSQTVFSAGNDNTVRCWNVDSYNCFKKFIPHWNGPKGFAKAIDRPEEFLSFCGHGTAKLVNWKKKMIVRRYSAENPEERSESESEHGSDSDSEDEDDIMEKENQRNDRKADEEVFAMVSIDKHTFVTGGKDGQLRAWNIDADKDQLICELDLEAGHVLSMCNIKNREFAVGCQHGVKVFVL